MIFQWLKRVLGGGKLPHGNSSRYCNAYCSFCCKTYLEVGPLVEGPREAYICGACIKLCQEILDKENQRLGTKSE